MLRAHIVAIRIGSTAGSDATRNQGMLRAHIVAIRIGSAAGSDKLKDQGMLRAHIVAIKNWVNCRLLRTLRYKAAKV